MGMGVFGETNCGRCQDLRQRPLVVLALVALVVWAAWEIGE